jgi:glycosyltransferase involved in cell wall biosynthesis
MKKNKHVMIATPVLLLGGTEIQTLSLIKVLLSCGYRITVCCYYEFDLSMVQQFEASGADVLLMKYERVAGLWHLTKGLIRLLKEQKPDIVHVQYLAPGFVPVFAAWTAGVKTIFATVHQPGRTYGRKEKILLRTVARFCKAFFCVSKAAEKSWFGDSAIFDPDAIKFKRKHFTIYNAVDVAKIDSIIRTANCDEIKRSLNISGRKIIGVLGRLRCEKGQKILLHAMSEVIRKCPDVMLLVVGNGPDLEDLKMTARVLGIQDCVIWLGMKTPDEVWQLYSIMDIVTVPSLFEGFGLVAAEAMAAGKSVVGSAVDGLCEVIEDGVTGYLIPGNDEQALAEALIQLLNNPALAKSMGENGRDRVSRLFSMERFSDSIRAAYNHFS